jgi:two-component system, OmpR family, sensor histidine kinase BaeS
MSGHGPPQEPPPGPRWGPPWAHYDSRPGRRPPWWPESEAWPPPGGWRSVRRRFVRRIALLLIGLFVALFALGAIWSAFAPRFGWWRNGALQNGGGPRFDGGAHFFPWLPLLVLVVIGVVVITRVLRRTAAPVGDVMDAANRLAAGDYTARAEARGSGEVRQLIDSFNAMAQRLEVNDEQRRALLAEIAHELRTPLSVMHGDVEGMLDGVYPRDDAHLRSVLGGSQRMTRLLEDLQTLSLAQAGALRLHREPTDPGLLVNEVRDAFAPQAAERGVALSARVDGLPELDVDPVRLRQVFDNLVANALRFTPSGGAVTIAAHVEGEFAAFAVSDTGQGIPPEQLAHLFERFAKSGDAKGSGLGLAIAKSLVESHGGSIAAQSELGRGTTIAFWLPLGPAT